MVPFSNHIEIKEGQTLIFKEPKSKIIRKVNSNLNKVNLKKEVDLLFNPITKFKNIEWKDNRKFNSTILNSFKGLQLSDLNDETNAISYLLPKDSSLYTYSWSNPKKFSDEDPLIRNYLINEQFNPYFNTPVFNFIPYYMYNNNIYFTFGLKPKYELIQSIQENFDNYIKTMFNYWFSDLNGIISEKLNDDNKKDQFQMLGLDYLIFLQMERNKQSLNSNINTITYSEEINESFLDTLMNSNLLTWYNSKRPITDIISKMNYNTDELSKDDKIYNSLIEIDYENIIPLHYAKTFKKETTMESVKLILDSLEKDLLNGVYYGNDIPITKNERFKFLVYLFFIQNKLVLDFVNLTEYLEKHSLEKKVFLNKDKQQVQSNIIRFDKDLVNEGSYLNKRIMDEFKKDLDLIKDVYDLALKVKYVSDTNWQEGQIIAHKFFDFGKGIYNSILIKYVPAEKYTQGQMDDVIKKKRTFNITNSNKGNGVTVDEGVLIDNEEDIGSRENAFIKTLKENEVKVYDFIRNERNINGKSIIFEFNGFKIILNNATRYNYSKDFSKASVKFENVIIVWDNFYIELFSYDSNNEGFYYKSYYSSNSGAKVELINGMPTPTRGDVSCVAIEFGPDMHLNYKYDEEEEISKKLDKLHSLFRNTYFIPAILFEKSEISIFGTNKNDESNTIEVEQLNGIYFNYGITNTFGRKLLNVKKRDNGKETVIYNGEKIEFENGKFKLDGQIIDNTKDNSIYGNIMVSKAKDDTKNEIVKDDKWKELFENYIKEKTQSDIYQDLSGSGYVRNSITNQSNKPKSKKASQAKDSIDDILEEF